MFKPKSAIELYNQAHDLYMEGRYDKALHILEQGQSVAPNMPEIHYTRGLCYQHLEKFEEAKQAFQETIKLNPDDADAMYNLARLFYNNADYDTALAYAEQADAIVGDKGDALVSYLLAIIHEQMGNVDEALAAYERSMELDPAQVLMGTFLAKLYVKKQDYTKAIDLLNRLLEEDPNSVEANYELALALAKTGDWEASIEYCKQVIEIDPTNVKGYNQYGLALYCTYQYAEAITLYEKALEIDASYHTALNNLAYAYEKQGDINKALEKFTLYMNSLPESSEERGEVASHIETLRSKQSAEVSVAAAISETTTGQVTSEDS